jgi:hypothetical protein
MRKLLLSIVLLIFAGCNKKTIVANLTSELPGVSAVNRINESSKITIKLLNKYDAFLKNNKKNIQMVDAELSQILLKQKTEYEILSQEKCPKDSNAKYWTSECTFGTKKMNLNQSQIIINENEDSIKVLSFRKTFASALESDSTQRISRFKSDENERIKLRIALAEYQFQLSNINKSKYDCTFRSTLFESYVVLIKCFYHVRSSIIIQKIGRGAKKTEIQIGGEKKDTLK